MQKFFYDLKEKLGGLKSFEQRYAATPLSGRISKSATAKCFSRRQTSTANISQQLFGQKKKLVPLPLPSPVGARGNRWGEEEKSTSEVAVRILTGLIGREKISV